MAQLSDGADAFAYGDSILVGEAGSVAVSAR